jgi:2-dehydro-3-deoxygluconokinase
MKIATFGEIMGRLVPDNFLRLRQALPGHLNVTFAGAEANVAASISTLGGDASFVTALPRNPLADACISSLKSVSIDTRHIVRSDEGRLGLYLLETGANQRPSQVMYDRDGSTISLTAATRYPWTDVFAEHQWFHTTGITPAISEAAADSTLDAVKQAKQASCRVSCDLNFRKKLWRWRDNADALTLAGETMRAILPYVDVVIANEEDCETVLGIHADDTNVESGELSIERYPDVAQEVIRQFPNVEMVAITLRESISATHNNWGAMLYVAPDQVHFAPWLDGTYQPYPIRNIVDRVGAGDSFAAGLIFALTTPELANPSHAVHFATASSCLAHSITGDLNYSTRAEVEALMGGATSGRVNR